MLVPPQTATNVDASPKSSDLVKYSQKRSIAGPIGPDPALIAAILHKTNTGPSGLPDR